MSVSLPDEFLTLLSRMRRLDQLLANLGYCSRREARQWLDAGRVTIGARVADDPAGNAPRGKCGWTASPSINPADC